jgi:hypothetical protein
MNKFTTLFVLLFILIYSDVFAQNTNDVTWDLSVRRFTGTRFQDLDPRMPVPLRSGEEYQIRLRFDSPGYCYVIQVNADRTSELIRKTHVTEGMILDLPSDEDVFIVPSGTGAVRFEVLVSSTQQANLEGLLNQSSDGRFQGAEHTALINEIANIRTGASTMALPAGRPGRMGATTRGEDQETIRVFFGERNTHATSIIITF